MPRTVAVVVTYWPNRTDNVGVILRALNEGDAVPDEIYVLNNNPTETPSRDSWSLHPNVHIIESSWNSMTRGKYVVALLDPAARYLLIDDDVAPGVESLRQLHEWCQRLKTPYDEFVTGFWGAILTPQGSFMQGTIIQPHLLAQPMRVNGFHGRYIYTTHAALVRMLEAEGRIRLDGRWPFQGCDILMGLVNSNASWAVPLRDQASWRELPDGGQALQHDPTYFAERDLFVADVLAQERSHL